MLKNYKTVHVEKAEKQKRTKKIYGFKNSLQHAASQPIKC